MITRYFHAVKRITLTILAMGGILLDRIAPQRIVLLLSMVFIYFLFGWFHQEIDPLVSILIFALVFISRYLFLFFSFSKNGIAYYLKRKFGENRGFEVYKLITALMFFLSASSFSLMLYKSKFGIPFYSRFNSFFITIGTSLLILGIIVNVWSALMIGIDVYYYKDLFLGKPVGEFKKAGPYSLFANPMYSIGQANGYGSALISGSVFGIMFIFLNQLMMYVFYLTIERPHIKKLFPKNNLTS